MSKEIASESIWNRSFECIGGEGGARYHGNESTSLEETMELGALYRKIGTNYYGEPTYMIVCTRPEYRHFEETGWLHVWKWVGSARELVQEGIEIDDSLRGWFGSEPEAKLTVFDKRNNYSYPTNDVWTIKNKKVYRNGRQINEQSDIAFKKLGWIIRRMTQRNGKREYRLVLKDEMPNVIQQLGEWEWK